MSSHTDISPNAPKTNLKTRRGDGGNVAEAVGIYIGFIIAGITISLLIYCLIFTFSYYCVYKRFKKLDDEKAARELEEKEKEEKENEEREKDERAKEGQPGPARDLNAMTDNIDAMTDNTAVATPVLFSDGSTAPGSPQQAQAEVEVEKEAGAKAESSD